MRAVVLAILLIVSLPSMALAGSASVGTDAPWLSSGSTRQVLTYAAAPGERNEIVLSRAAQSPLEFVLRDGGAPVVAGAGCTRLDEHAVHCRALDLAPPGVFFADLGAVIEAGDGDDSITVPPLWSAPVWARGGDGSDALSGAGTLAGGAGDDVLVGGLDVVCPAPCRRRDTLVGGSGNDVLRGGVGDDVLIGDGEGPQPFSSQPVQPDGAAGDDVLDGGEGRDEVWYAGRAAAVRVDLADPGPDGSAGERDRLVGIEMATGGNAADVLLGSSGPDTLDGDDGADRLDGRSGDDIINGGNGADVLRGGEGDDRLQVGYVTAAVFGGPGDDTFAGGLTCSRAFAEACDPGPKSNAHADIQAPIDCGSGHDRMVSRIRNFPLLTRCEDAGLVPALVHPQAQRRRGGRLRFTWRCRAASGCRLTMRLHIGKSVVAIRTVRASSADRRRRTFEMRPARALPRGAAIGVSVGGRGFLAGGGFIPFRGTWSTRP